MAEYITKEAVIQAFEWGDVDVFEDCGDGYISGFSRDAIKNTINSIPAADVAPVRHGRWVDKPLIKSFKHTNIPVVECSACGIDFCDIINNHYFMYKYCPKCGAKMDGGVDDACL